MSEHERNNHIHLESADEIIRALASALDLPQLEEIEIIAHENYQLPVQFLEIPSINQERVYSDHETVFVNIQQRESTSSAVPTSSTSQVCKYKGAVENLVKKSEKNVENHIC